ncbi:uncharacterized protein N7477_007228 [Penicillium maclennaniae]|uniref:uncharacterized protein n=1 Tax=Penicillium maclennaniae TaxID=1343394 RepID=UPI0025423A02|nr:uncharacterized protein N7477_007228 [Penicillium maclennaniae]KAJ5664780.1 hypothetical protein N7477_007228 [Penicillium maclennaniae]
MSALHRTNLEASQYVPDYAYLSLSEMDILLGAPTVVDISQCFLSDTPRHLSAILSPHPNNMGAEINVNDPSQFQAIENIQIHDDSGSTTQHISGISSIYGVHELNTDGGIERASNHQVPEEAKSDSAVPYLADVSGCSNAESRNRLYLQDRAKM